MSRCRERARYANAEEVQAYTGIAPVTERSGKKKWVHFRWACPKFLRQTVHEWAGHSVPHSQWAPSYYQQQRERGKGHHAAVRGLVFNLSLILRKVLGAGTPRQWKDLEGTPFLLFIYYLLVGKIEIGSPEAESQNLVRNRSSNHEARLAARRGWSCRKLVTSTPGC